MQIGGPVSTTETIGTLILGAGSATVQTGYAVNNTGAVNPTPGTSAVLTFTSLVRNTGATVNFQANSTSLPGGAFLGSSYNKVAFTNIPTLSGNNGGILPYALVSNNFASGQDFATYDTVNSSIAAFTNYRINASGSGDTVKLTGVQTLAADNTITRCSSSAALRPGGQHADDRRGGFGEYRQNNRRHQHRHRRHARIRRAGRRPQHR